MLNRGSGRPIVVVGSVNMDLVARVTRRPEAGETLSAASFGYSPGGKGANQAVAAARLGAPTYLVARVGDDAFGPRLRENLSRHGVRTERVFETSHCPSGLAWIHVDDAGENAITIVAGANARLTPDDVEAAGDLIEQAAALVLQLEVPLETVAHAAELGRRAGVPVLLDPAPAPTGSLPASLRNVDLITPNQTEAASLTGLSAESVDQAEEAARRLLAMGVQRVVIKLGARGALLLEQGGASPRPVPPFRVKAIDTTAAGDAFTAGLAVGLGEGLPLNEAARLACASGALATTRHGAQDAMPSREEVERLLQS